MTSATITPPALVEQLGLFCQRWSRRRASYRPAGELFDPRYVSVERISEQDAKAFVLREHYSGSYPAARFRAGVLVKEPFRRERLAGVGVFSVPMNQKVVPAYFAGLDASCGVELGRFVLDATLAANAAIPSSGATRPARWSNAVTWARSTRRPTRPIAARPALALSGCLHRVPAWPTGCSRRCASRSRASAMPSSAWLRSGHRVGCRTRAALTTSRG